MEKAVATTGANPRAPGPRAPAPKQPREGGRAKILASLSCALTIGALWDTSKYKKVSRSDSEPLGVTILLLRYQS